MDISSAIGSRRSVFEQRLEHDNMACWSSYVLGICFRHRENEYNFLYGYKRQAKSRVLIVAIVPVINLE